MQTILRNRLVVDNDGDGLMDETAGSVAVDSVGTRNGTVSDQAWAQPGANAGSGTVVMIGTGGELLGHGPASMPAFTLIFWINAAYSGYHRIASIGTASDHLSISRDEDGDWELVMNFEESFGSGEGVHAGWQHIAFAGSGGTMSLYLGSYLYDTGSKT